MCEDQSDALSLTSFIWTEIVQCRRHTLSLSGRKGPAVSDLEMEFLCLIPLKLEEDNSRPCIFPLKLDTQVV